MMHVARTEFGGGGAMASRWVRSPKNRASQEEELNLQRIYGEDQKDRSLRSYKLILHALGTLRIFSCFKVTFN